MAKRVDDRGVPARDQRPCRASMSVQYGRYMRDEVIARASSCPMISRGVAEAQRSWAAPRIHAFK